MVRIAQYGLMVAASAVLLSCASPRMSEELEGGKYAFRNGDYRQAFHQLLPVAVKGRPEAQYAVGYMYYYGYGVPQDTESGIFWMQKAAEQNYQPAIKALALIHQTNAEQIEQRETYRYSVYKNDEQTHDEVLKTLPSHPTPEPLIKTPHPDVPTSLPPLQRPAEEPTSPPPISSPPIRPKHISYNKIVDDDHAENSETTKNIKRK